MDCSTHAWLGEQAQTRGSPESPRKLATPSGSRRRRTVPVESEWCSTLLQHSGTPDLETWLADMHLGGRPAGPTWREPLTVHRRGARIASRLSRWCRGRLLPHTLGLALATTRRTTRAQVDIRRPCRCGDAVLRIASRRRSNGAHAGAVETAALVICERYRPNHRSRFVVSDNAPTQAHLRRR
jgi:hypothetical protein